MFLIRYSSFQCRKAKAVCLRADFFHLTLRPLTLLVLLALSAGQVSQAAEDAIEFNTDVLDVKDRSRIDLNQFSRAGYLLPGDYHLVVRINKAELPEQTISFIAPDDDPKGSEPCLTPELVSDMGLKESALRQVTWWHNGQCMNTASLEGMTARADLGTGALYLSIPQAWLEYTSESWDPPSRWDNGVTGLLFDYDINAMDTRQAGSGKQQSVSGNGTTGVNLGPWRLRADWQASYDRTSGQTGSTQKSWDWSRYYAYRAITSLRAKLMMGENYLSSSMFDSFRFTGLSLETDDSQLPPNLRGYAPEVTGVAKTNAKVTITQQGRVLYETTVAAGPFRIQDLNDTVTGKLDVKVQEQDGSVQTFQVDTASIPYLSRPGLVRYKVSAGKPSDYDHHSQGPDFLTSEFSWGVNNGWSLYGGGLFAGDYNALALGLGRDLLAFGALSFDVTQSRAVLPDQKTRQGGSYRLSYSKRFDEYDSQITFAGYRFSEREFMSMTQYLDTRYHSATSNGNGKELYTVSLNKQFRDVNMSTYLNYSHQTYWDREANNTWNASVSTYFDAGTFRNVSLNLSASRTKVNGKNDDGMYVSLSLPWGRSAALNYSGQFGGGVSSHSVGYYDRIDENNNYRISAGAAQGGDSTASGYFTHEGDIAEMTANASYNSSNYRAFGMSLRGGMTATLYGAALHRAGNSGGTRMMVDTDGVSNVPVRGYGGVAHTNLFGKAVITDISSYYRSSVNVDLDALPDDVDATRSVIQDTLTEGAIGYRKFGILSGQKAMAVIKLADGSAPPFGSTVTNADQIQTGVVGDGGNVWLTGLRADGVMNVSWSGEVQCHIHLPPELPEDMSRTLLLPCEGVTGGAVPDGKRKEQKAHDVAAAIPHEGGLSYGAIGAEKDRLTHP